MTVLPPMSPSRATPNDAAAQRAATVATAESVLMSHLDQQLRFWQLYLRATTIQLVASLTLDDTVPLLDIPYDAGEPTLRAADANRTARNLLDRIPTDVRETFATYLEARRRAAQRLAEATARQEGRPLPDADTCYRALLDALTSDALGGNSAGMAEVPYGTTTYLVAVARLEQPPTDGEYLAMGTPVHGPNPRVLLLLVGLLLVGSLVVGLTFFWPAAPAPFPAAAPGELRINTRAAPLLVPASLVLTTTTETGQVMELIPAPLTPVGWQHTDATKAGISTTWAPRFICLPNAALMASVSLTSTLALLDPDGGQQHYRVIDHQVNHDQLVTRLATQAPDLVVGSCDGTPPWAIVTLDHYLAPPVTPTGTSLVLPTGTTLQVRSTQVVHADMDPTIPTGLVAVEVTLAVQGDPAPLATMPLTLVLPDLTVVALNGAPRVGTDTATLRFVLDPAQTGQSAILTMTPPATFPRALQVDLPPAPTITDLVGDLGVSVEQVAVMPHPDTGLTMSVTLSLHNPTATARPAHLDHLVMRQDGIDYPVTVLLPAVLPLVLSTAQTQTVVVTTDLPVSAPAMLHYGLSAWQIDPSH